METLTLANPPPSSTAAAPFFRVPLVISESLRSAIAASASSSTTATAPDFSFYDADSFTGNASSSPSGIVSILLSRADLAKLDLSNLQLFSVHGHDHASSSSLQSSSNLNSSDDSFSFPRPPELQSTDLEAINFPVLKSKAVMEAERASVEHELLKRGAVSTSPRGRKKALSMDELSFVNEEFDEIVTDSVASCASSVHGGDCTPTQTKVSGLEEKANALKKKHFQKILSRALSEVEETSKIDLQASPAAKFLLQVMPWELTPPVTPVTKPAAIPFQWEVEPGKPSQPRDQPSPFPSLPLPPRLAMQPSAPDQASSMAETPDSISKSSSSGRGRHRKNTHSWHVLQNLFSGHSRSSSQAMDAMSIENAFQSSDQELKTFPLRPGEQDSTTSSSPMTLNSSEFASSDFSPSVDTVSEGNHMEVAAPDDKDTSLPQSTTEAVPSSIVKSQAQRSKTRPLNSIARFARRVRHQSKCFSVKSACFNPFINHHKVSNECKSCLLDESSGFQSGSKHIQAEVMVDSANSCSSTPTSSSKLSRDRKRRGVRNPKFFCKLRRGSSRVVVVTYKAIKQALNLKKGGHSELPYQTLEEHSS